MSNPNMEHYGWISLHTIAKCKIGCSTLLYIQMVEIQLQKLRHVNLPLTMALVQTGETQRISFG